MSQPDRAPSRRDVLKAGGALAAASVCSGCAAFNKNDEDLVADPKATQVEFSLKAHPKLAEPGGFINVEARDGDERIVIVRSPEGQVVALTMICTHWGCDVDYVKAKNEFECPCHGSRFDLAGGVLEGPAEDPLRRFEVVDRGDGTYVLELGAPS